MGRMTTYLDNTLAADTREHMRRMLLQRNPDTEIIETDAFAGFTYIDNCLTIQSSLIAKGRLDLVRVLPGQLPDGRFSLFDTAEPCLYRGPISEESLAVSRANMMALNLREEWDLSTDPPTKVISNPMHQMEESKDA